MATENYTEGQPGLAIYGDMSDGNVTYPNLTIGPLTDVSFAASGKTIISDVTDFAAAGIKAGDIIAVTGSSVSADNGTFTVASCTTSTIVTNEALTDADDALGDSIVIVQTGKRLAKDMFYNKLNIGPGFTLIPFGYRIFAREIEIGSTGVISWDGNAGAIGASGSGGAGGAALTAATIGGSVIGSAGGAAAAVGVVGTANADQYGGLGGGGGAGSNAGGAAATTVQAASVGEPRSLPQALTLVKHASTTKFAGGGAGAGGGAAVSAHGGGGGGGSGGGIILLTARNITNLGTISAKGGAGGAGEADLITGGGGGGGGGVIVMVYETFYGNAPNVSGGLGGAKNSTGVVGTAGAVGKVIHVRNG